MGHGCWSADALTASRERATSRRLGSLARPAWLCVCWPVSAVEAFRLRDACWNPASSPGTNPPGVEALVVVEEGGARGGGVVRVGSEGLFKGVEIRLTDLLRWCEWLVVFTVSMDCCLYRRREEIGILCFFRSFRNIGSVYIACGGAVSSIPIPVSNCCGADCRPCWIGD